MKNKLFILLITFIVIVDQISKIIVTSFLNENDTKVIINNLFSITYSKNYGAAFGIFKDYQIFILIFSIFLLVYLIYEFIITHSKNIKISLSLIIGGLTGNLIDRICLGYVRDFFDFSLFSHHFAIFNVSDAFIVIGTFLFIIFFTWEEKNGRKKEN